jgi:hypothetical protein
LESQQRAVYTLHPGSLYPSHEPDISDSAVIISRPGAPVGSPQPPLSGFLADLPGSNGEPDSANHQAASGDPVSNVGNVGWVEPEAASQVNGHCHRPEHGSSLPHDPTTESDITLPASPAVDSMQAYREVF